MVVVGTPRFFITQIVGHTPSTAGTFRKKFRKYFGKTPETLSERFLEFPSRVRLGCPKPYSSRHLRLAEHFQNSLPPSTAGDASFFRSGSGEGLSEPAMEFPAVLGYFPNWGSPKWPIPPPHTPSPISKPSLTLQSCFFGKSKGFSPKKARAFLLAEPLKSLEKRGKTHKKKQGKSENKKKTRKSKKTRIGGSGF